MSHDTEFKRLLLQLPLQPVFGNFYSYKPSGATAWVQTVVLDVYYWAELIETYGLSGSQPMTFDAWNRHVAQGRIAEVPADAVDESRFKHLLFQLPTYPMRREHYLMGYYEE